MAREGDMPGAATAAAVLNQKIRTLFRQSPWVLAVNPLNAAIVGTVLWVPSRGVLIVAWVAATALATTLRAALRALYFAARAPSEVVWAHRYAAATAFQGLMWGAGSVLLYTSGDHTSELILIFVLAGMTAGAAGTLGAYLPAFFAFVGPALLPLSVRFIVEGDRLHVAMGGLGMLYGVAIAIAAQNTNHALAEAFRLRFENDGLLARLSGAQSALEDANRTLERRVEERSLALKRQDEALHEARRMESLGLLAGGIAHDFNNLLTVILGNAALLQDSPALADAADGPLPEIGKAAERAASLVSQLLASSRRQARTPRVLDLNAVVSDAERLLARLIGEHIRLVVSLRPAPLPTFADPGQLEQVIVNLATNARDAMPAGGTLTIETAETFVASGDAEAARGLLPGPYVELAVRDTGVGMDAETRRLAFYPFFTTKEVGHGTGLGLATVSGIVEQSGGRIFVDSEPGQGSSFSVFLPRTEAPVAKEAAHVEAAPPRRTATVLLVEDEPMVRSVMARALEGAGMTVLAADDGERALARARAHEGRIDLLVTDVVMAHMGGFELASRLAGERPGLRVLFISGYGREVHEPQLRAEEGVDFLQKPFTSNALVDRAGRLLAAGAGHPPAPSRSGGAGHVARRH
jgi:signal transduction histidine kinase